MEKKIYEKPIMQVEAFVAANYCVEKCGDIERKYSFVCTSQSGIMYLYNNSPASGPKPSTSHSRTRIGRYSPCGFAHEAPTSGDFNWGFIDRNGNGSHRGGRDPGRGGRRSRIQYTFLPGRTGYRRVRVCIHG